MTASGIFVLLILVLTAVLWREFVKRIQTLEAERERSTPTIEPPHPHSFQFREADSPDPSRAAEAAPREQPASPATRQNRPLTARDFRRSFVLLTLYAPPRALAEESTRSNYRVRP